MHEIIFFSSFLAGIITENLVPGFFGDGIYQGTDLQLSQ
jgi:hypothetical protein